LAAALCRRREPLSAGSWIAQAAQALAMMRQPEGDDMLKTIVSVGLGWSLAGHCLAAGLSGQVELFLNDRPLRSEEARDVVVYFRPDERGEVQPLAGPLELRTERKQFVPRSLPVTVGTTVSFPNSDPILHNVFSPPGANSFDLGLYGQGESKQFTFDTPGLVRVYCNVHHNMVAHILVLDTPHFVAVDGDGRFRLEGLPEGEGELFVWHERARLWRQRLDPASAAALDVRLDLTRPRVPPHMNKFGQPYGSQRRGSY